MKSISSSREVIVEKEPSSKWADLYKTNAILSLINFIQISEGKKDIKRAETKPVKDKSLPNHLEKWRATVYYQE